MKKRMAWALFVLLFASLVLSASRLLVFKKYIIFTANRVGLGFFCHKFSNSTPPPLPSRRNVTKYSPLTSRPSLRPASTNVLPFWDAVVTTVAKTVVLGEGWRDLEVSCGGRFIDVFFFSQRGEGWLFALLNFKHLIFNQRKSQSRLQTNLWQGPQLWKPCLLQPMPSWTLSGNRE